ncbi:hypothetical protein ABZ651_33685, partial [Streptomyces sp. NPDC007070]
MTDTSTVREGQAHLGVIGVRARGRHRRSRRRKALLAAGGLALAAGALGLVRLAPEYAGGGLGTAEAESPPVRHAAPEASGAG